METCRYYIKKSNNPRICCKKSHPKNTFSEQGGVAGLHLCDKHFNMVQMQIVNAVAGSFDRRKHFDFNKIIRKWDAAQLTQMNSLLQFRKDEFYRKSDRVLDGVVETNKLPEGEWQNILVAFQILENDVKKSEESKSDIISGAVVASVPEQQKECPVCLETISVKKMSFLECAHALCNQCLRKLEKKECPVCRHEF